MSLEFIVAFVSSNFLLGRYSYRVEDNNFVEVPYLFYKNILALLVYVFDKSLFSYRFALDSDDKTTLIRTGDANSNPTLLDPTYCPT